MSATVVLGARAPEDYAPFILRHASVALFWALLVSTTSGQVVGCAVKKSSHLDLTDVTPGLPDREPLRGVCWSSDSQRAFLVGDNGRVLEAGEHLPEGQRTWTAIPTPTHEDLFAVAVGPMVDHGDRVGRPRERVFAVGDHGSLLECASGTCRALASGTDAPLRAVAAAGGQAVVVGDAGTVLIIRPDPSEARGNADDLRTEVLSPVLTTRDLKSIALVCKAGDGDSTCTAFAVGSHGTVVQGDGTGVCDNGVRTSGVAGHYCRWRWSVATVPTERDLLYVGSTDGDVIAIADGGARFARSPDGSWRVRDVLPGAAVAVAVRVHTVETSFWSSRESADVRTVSFGSDALAPVDGGRETLDLPGIVVSAASVPIAPGSMTLLVLGDGRVLLSK